jgi:small subunit ribosomal protein S27Ae
MKKIEIFKVDGNKINRLKKHCPKCGPGVFLADHKDRSSCGNCGYTEFKSKSTENRQSNNTPEQNKSNNQK